MKLFECQSCGKPLYFENTSCESCEFRLGFLPQQGIVSALEPVADRWRPLAEPDSHYRFCANAEHEVCNWLVPWDNQELYCVACRHNRTIPDLTNPENIFHWRKIEFAKHRLFYTLLRLGLPLTTRFQDAFGLAFDFLSDSAGRVMTGHSNGLITLNVAEADDLERERQRQTMNEPYRTLLGHFRHEIAHYYWDRLVANGPAIAEFRQLFGDERSDYFEALGRYYADGPASNWAEQFVTAYASAHPWEDFAETWAHYLHMVDTIETAGAFGMQLRPPLARGPDLAAVIDFDPHTAPIERLIDIWLPLTFAMNSINRSMGQQDLYPFALAPPVISKLTFVHDRIRGNGQDVIDHSGKNTLRAIVAALRRVVGSTN